MIEDITSINTQDLLTTSIKRDNQTPNAEFIKWIKEGVNEINSKLINSEEELRKFAIGETQNLHQLMITLEKSKLNFELFMQVRNKMIEGYKEILRMQV
ncbi:MAG: flagellar hook-basal body complex protein FliE [Candidatus Thiodiazotropha sp. (ex Dulcina madagascariensis)]|nr:flagellar hook-basal body complex protein FliE [Candidatus Thiodiazotropha sp. (ex Epidulcina cf. delphinae)]MCU7922536.1 flagellar hook-basal body complex protein FliE [Candidatus Thiodiazotropha sp. (ex Dulcina madagascariensis)]MCU7925837.1 flagellar hook-basal body complex protein FliE [Candidatus Thiodiazotropha sp. (ex Dulcina madagascariensis)]